MRIYIPFYFSLKKEIDILLLLYNILKKRREKEKIYKKKGEKKKKKNRYHPTMIYDPRSETDHTCSRKIHLQHIILVLVLILVIVIIYFDGREDLIS